MGDLHCRDDHHGRFRQFVQQVNAQADLLLLCGDLTDRGTVAEARVLAEELSALRIPTAAVMGNHDYESDQAKEVREELVRIGIRVLDGESFVLDGLGVVGVKGFGGGYGNATLQAFGEPQTKAFVHAAVTESLKLERALADMPVEKRVVVLHYSPVAETLEGENVEVRPYLGTSRLAMAVDHYGALAVFHGHAHHGSPRGHTRAGIPVYNVALPLMARLNPEQRFLLMEV